MRLTAQEIIKAIGSGVETALATNRLFLGVEVDAFQNADIHPEYVTTVEVAKKLTQHDRHVSLETHMKVLREQARWLARMHQGWEKATVDSIDAILAPYKFGKKNSQRLDILVRSSDPGELPLLIAEAKLGSQNLSGVTQDIDRILRLLTMYQDLQLLGSLDVYGAVVFHSMEEGNDTGKTTGKAKGLLTKVQTYLTTVTNAKPWLSAKAGLIQHGSIVEPVAGYTEYYPDGKTEDVFAKRSFSFAPGLVLLGNASDINSVQF